MCFLNLEPRNIALHQIQKIMFFLAMVYEPFKYLSNYLIWAGNLFGNSRKLGTPKEKFKTLICVVLISSNNHFIQFSY